MKYNITIALLWVSFIAFAQNPEVALRISFNGFHCDGKHGLCDIDLATNETTANSRICYNDVLNTIILTISRDGLSREEEISVLGELPVLEVTSKNQFFELEEDRVLTNRIKEALRIDIPQLAMLKGRYPIKITKDEITILFKIR